MPNNTFHLQCPHPPASLLPSASAPQSCYGNTQPKRCCALSEAPCEHSSHYWHSFTLITKSKINTQRMGQRHKNMCLSRASQETFTERDRGKLHGMEKGFRKASVTMRKTCQETAGVLFYLHL